MQDDDDDFEQIAEQIQVGDASEGAAALKRLVEKSGRGRDIGNEVRGVLAHDRVRAEMQEALSDIQRKNPGLVNDELLADAGMSAIRNEIAKDFRAIGVPDEELRKIKGSNEVMLGAYTNLRASGRQMRAPGEIFDAAAQDLRSRGVRFKTVSDRTPRNVIAEMREARGFKSDEEHIPSPRSAGAADEKRRERNIAALNQMRKSRGFDLYE